MTEELTQEEIDRVLAQAREENRKYEAIAKRMDEVVDGIQRLCDEYLQLKAGKVPERCYCCEDLRETAKRFREFGHGCLYFETEDKRRYFLYCPECGRKL